MSVYTKIFQVMQKVQYLQKDGFVQTGRDKNGKLTGYKAMTDEKVASVLRPALLEAGLVILPIKVTAERTDESVINTDKDGNAFEKRNRVTDVHGVYRIVDIDTCDYIDVESCGCGVDTQDKGVGKAMTYSRKNMLLNTFLIPTGNDTDDISSDMYDKELYGDNAETSIPQPDAELLRQQILVIAPKKGVDITKIIKADYNGRKWNELNTEDLLAIKKGLVERSDV